MTKFQQNSKIQQKEIPKSKIQIPMKFQNPNSKNPLRAAPLPGAPAPRWNLESGIWNFHCATPAPSQADTDMLRSLQSLRDYIVSERFADGPEWIGALDRVIKKSQIPKSQIPSKSQNLK